MQILYALVILLVTGEPNQPKINIFKTQEECASYGMLLKGDPSISYMACIPFKTLTKS